MKSIRTAGICTLVVILMAALVLCACQPTPEKAAVTNKGTINFEQSIKETATLPPAETASDTNNEKNEEKIWKYNKDYDSGNRLIVDAVMYNTDAEKLPVLSVAPKMFESGDQIKKFVDIFCPNANVCDQGDSLTKAQLGQAITDVKQEIFNVENDLPPYPGAEEPIPEDDKENYLSGLNEAVEYYEQQLSAAPDTLKQASYQLREVEDGSIQANITAEENGAISYIDFVNRETNEKGSMFKYQCEAIENRDEYDVLVPPETLKQDEKFIQTRDMVETVIKNMGIDYMSLSSVSRGEDSYSFYYTRNYSGLMETYVQSHTGTSATGVDSGPVIYLWDPEYASFEVQNNKLVQAYWHNPAEIINVDNDNVQVKSWEEIQEIFKTSMDYLMTPEPVNNGEESPKTILPEKTEVHINRIELGLTKILIKDSMDDYKLIPTWNFMGYESGAWKPVEEGVNIGADCCFVTINAIDGTVIDRGLMY